MEVHFNLEELFEIPKDLDIDDKVDKFIDVMRKHKKAMLNINTNAFTKIFGCGDNIHFVASVLRRFNKREGCFSKTIKTKRGRNIKIYFTEPLIVENNDELPIGDSADTE